MKLKTLLFLSLLAMAITVRAQSNTFKITGQIDNIADGDSVTLLKLLSDRIGMPYLKSEINKGKFVFEDTINAPQKFVIVPIGKNFPPVPLKLWIAPNANIEITGNSYYTSTWNIVSPISDQQDNDFYRMELNDLYAVSDSLLREYYRSIDELMSASNNEDRYHLAKSNEAKLAQTDSIDILIQHKTLDLMADKPITENWINRLSEISQYARKLDAAKNNDDLFIKQLQKLYYRLSNEQKQSQKGQVIYRNVFPLQLVQVGQPIAQAELFDPQGYSHQIAKDYKGKYLLLDFWSVACAPCIMAFPEMKEIHEAYNSKLTIISISTDPERIWKEGLERHQLPWVNLTDNLEMEGYASRYGIRGIPFYILISPDGIVKKMWSGYGKGMLKEILNDVL